MVNFFKKLKNKECTAVGFKSPFGISLSPVVAMVCLGTALLAPGSVSFAQKVPASSSLVTSLDSLKETSSDRRQDRTFEDLEFLLLSASPSINSDVELIRKFQEDSKNPRWPYLLSILYLKLKTQNQDDGNYLVDASARMARESFEMSRGDSFGYLALANLLSFGKQHDKALGILQKIKGAFPGDSWRSDLFEIKVLFAAGRSKEGTEKIRTLMTNENKAVRLTAMNLCANFCTNQWGSFTENELLNWRRNSLSPDSIIVSVRLFAAKGQSTQSRLMLKDGLKSFPTDIPLTHELARELTSNAPADPDYALKILDSALIASTSAASGFHDLQKSSHYKLMGFAWLLKNNQAQAEAYFLKALALNPSPDFAMEIMDDYRSEKLAKAGISFLEKAIEICPGSSTLHALRGELYAEESRGFLTSEDSYLDAITLNPRNSSHFNSLGLLYYKFKFMDKALTSFSIATTLNPRDANAFYNLACMEALAGKNEKALAALSRAIELLPNLQVLATQDSDLNSLHVLPQFNQLTSGILSH